MFILPLAAYLLSGTLGYLLLLRLRRRHTGAWEALGRPTWVNYYRSSTFSFLRFLWRREYRSLPDEQTIRFAAFVRGSFVASLVVYVVVGGLLAAGLLIVVPRAIEKIRAP